MTGCKHRSNPRGRRLGGSSLLEVLIALSLVASAVLGAAAAQLAALRSGDAQTRREQAAWIVASVAESLSAEQPSSSVLAYARARADAVLPGAQVSIGDEARGIGAIVVAWPHGTGSPEHGRSWESSGWPGSPGFSGSSALAPCRPAGDGILPRCIALPLASRR